MMTYMHEDILSSDGSGWVWTWLITLAQAIFAPSLPFCNGSGHTMLLNAVVADDL